MTQDERIAALEAEVEQLKSTLLTEMQTLTTLYVLLGQSGTLDRELVLKAVAESRSDDVGINAVFAPIRDRLHSLHSLMEAPKKGIVQRVVEALSHGSR